MRGVFATALLLLATACVPSEEQKAAEAKAATEFNECVAKGGDVFHISDPGSSFCQPAENEKQRQSNLAALAFEKKCWEAGGWVSDNNVCTYSVEDSLQSCDTSADCSGTCVKSDMMVPRGFCGPARPLLGCFTEFGAAKPNRICAE